MTKNSVRPQLAGSVSLTSCAKATGRALSPQKAARHGRGDCTRSLSVRRSPLRHRPRCRSTSPLTPAWSARAMTARREDSLGAPVWIGVVLVRRIECVPQSARSGPARRLGDRACGRIAGSPDEVSRGADVKRNPPASGPPARSTTAQRSGWPACAFELHRPPRLVLYRDGVRRHLAAMTHVSKLGSNEVASHRRRRGGTPLSRAPPRDSGYCVTQVKLAATFTSPLPL